MTKYNANEVYGERYYEIPKVFFTNETYRKLSSDSKLAYGVLKDRFRLSVKNGWLDDNGDIFFIFTNEKLSELLDCSPRTVTTIKKALIKANLLEVVRTGNNKPDKLYLLKPEVTKDDVYLIHKGETLEAVGKSKNCTSGSEKYASPEEQNLHSNELELKELELKDFERKDIIKAVLEFYDFESKDISFICDIFQEKQLEAHKHILIKQASKMDTMMKLGEAVYHKPKYFITGYEALLEAHNKSEILRAKKKAKQEAKEEKTSTVPFYNWLES